MDVVILAGGQGTRLRSLFPDLPKPLAPIRGEPFLNLLLRQLSREVRIDRVILAVGHRASEFIDYYRRFPVAPKVDFSVEEYPLGTAGALFKALPLIADDSILVLNGDSYVDLNWTGFLAAPTNVLVLARDKSPDRFGSVHFDERTGLISDFSEKQFAANAGWSNCGIYRFDRATLESEKKRLWNSFQKVSLEYEVFPHLSRQGKLYGYPTESAITDIGTPKSYAEAKSMFEQSFR